MLAAWARHGVPAESLIEPTEPVVQGPIDMISGDKQNEQIQKISPSTDCNGQRGFSSNAHPFGPFIRWGIHMHGQQAANLH
jgi:hypothetical protein